MAERLFTAEELEELGMRSVDAVQKAIDAGDRDKAKGLSRRMYREFQAMHDLYVGWVTSLLSFIGRRYGDEVLYEALEESCGMWLKPLLEQYAQATPRRRGEMLFAGLRGHLQPMKIEEDDEKFTIIMQPCGSGGRLALQGSYEPSGSLLRIKKPQLMTYWRENFPAYCAHCTFQETIPIDLSGAPWLVAFPAQKIGEENCLTYYYKDPQAVPDEVYRRVNRKKKK